MALITIKGFLATSDPLPAYGGIAFAPETMYGLAETVRNGKMPLRTNHDERTLLHPNILVAEVRKTPSGSAGVWIEFEIDEQEWEKYGSLNAFSIAVVSDFFKSNPENTNPLINIYADAGHYDKEALQSTVRKLEKHFSVSGGRLYQFNILPPAKIIIEFALTTIQAIPPNILSSVLYDALKGMLLKSKVTASKVKEQKAQQHIAEPESITCIRIKGEYGVPLCQDTESDRFKSYFPPF